MAFRVGGLLTRMTLYTFPHFDLHILGHNVLAINVAIITHLAFDEQIFKSFKALHFILSCSLFSHDMVHILQLYTSTQGNAAKVLTNDRVQNVNYDLVIRHYPVNTSPERAANAIKYMVERYRYSFKIH